MRATDRWTRRATILGAAAATAAGFLAPDSACAFDVAADGFAKVPGGRVYWRRFGQGNKTPLLTLHGGPGAAHNYLLSMRALAEGRPVIMFDQLGCGRADAPEDESLYTIERSVAELGAVREALGLERVILHGHSWGTLLAIEYICRGHGAGVEKLILSGAFASVPQVIAGMDRLIRRMPDGFAGRLRALEAAGRTGTPEYKALADKFYGEHVIRVEPTPDALASFAALEKSIACRVLNGPNEFTIVGRIKDWDRRKDLKAITQPTLITTGEFDEITLDCHETLRDGIPNARLAIMTGCSHLTMVEQPAAYNRILRAFMDDGTSTSASFD
jgi:proline iminopeptidase